MIELKIVQRDGSAKEDTYQVNKSVADMETEIKWALAGAQGLREIVLHVSYGTVIIPAKILHNSIITIKQIS